MKSFSLHPASDGENTNAATPVAELDEADERSWYDRLEEASSELTNAAVALFAPGQLDLVQAADAGHQVHRLLTAIEAFRGTVNVVRRALGGRYRFSVAFGRSPTAATALRILAGLAAAPSLELSTRAAPRGQERLVERLLPTRLGAALTLVAAGSERVAAILESRLRSEVQRETLRLLYLGIRDQPYPLTHAEAAKASRYYQVVSKTGKVSQYAHTSAKGRGAPDENTMAVRDHALRTALARNWREIALVEATEEAGGEPCST